MGDLKRDGGWYPLWGSGGRNTKNKIVGFETLVFKMGQAFAPSPSSENQIWGGEKKFVI